jgi:iron complex transport system substrate-binding protein
VDPFPQRIVCLTEEPTEVLYSLGEERRIVGISAFTVRPARARREKKVVSGFTNANVAAIVALEPDLVVGFSDIQAEIAKELVGRGVEVWIANHRSVEGILAYVRRLGAIVGAMERAERLARELEEHVASVRASAAKLPRRPRVYFEEWDEPRISAIRWVSELIEVAGGVDVFAARSRGRLAKERLVAAGDGELRDEVVHAAPDVMLASRGPAGRRSRPCATANCTRSTRRRSCSRDRRRSPTDSTRSTRGSSRGRSAPSDADRREPPAHLPKSRPCR